jgi:glycine oxidase
MAKKIIVIGAGIVGSSIAWRLAREGAEVTVLERGRIGREASWAAAGMIAPQAEAQGEGTFFELCLRGRDVFPDTLAMLRLDSSVDPEYDDSGILYVAFNDEERAELEQRSKWQVSAGGAVEEVSPAAARKIEPGLSADIVYAVRMPLDRRTDNRKLTSAFASAAIAKGARFIEGMSVDSITIEGGAATGVVTSDGRAHPSDLIIVAAGAWSGKIDGLDADRIETYPVRGQILCFDAQPGTISASVFSARGYLVPRRDGRILAGSTMEDAGFDKSVTLSGVAKISRAAAEMAPALGNLAFREAWAGLRPATRDFLPIIGLASSAPNVFFATGHFRSGILLSAITAELVNDLVNGRKSSLNLEPFSPARFKQKKRIRALGLVRDILFRSRIDAAAQAVGVEVAYASDLEQAARRCRELSPAAIFVDLSDAAFPASPVLNAMRTATDALPSQMVGFASHVDLKALSSAREAGFNVVVSRSEFTSRLAEFLK